MRVGSVGSSSRPAIELLFCCCVTSWVSFPLRGPSGQSAAIKIDIAYFFRTAGTFLVAVVLAGELTQGRSLAVSLSFIFCLGGPPY